MFTVGKVPDVAAFIHRTLVEATGISDQEAGEIWAKMPDSPFRKLIQYEIESRKALESDKCATAAPDKILKHQGIVEGLGIALGIMARKDQK